MSIKSIRRWWQLKTGRVDTPMDGGVPFWIMSLAFHLLIIALLAKVIMPDGDDEIVALTVEEPVETLEEEPDFPLQLQFEEMPTDEIGADGKGGLEAAAAQAPEFSLTSEDSIDLEMKIHDFGEKLTDDDFMEATGENISALPVKGSVGHSVQAASGAIDRLTQEILLSMEERKTTVIWLFDQSASLMRQRDEIRSRFDRIYHELGLIRDAGHAAFANKEDAPLLTQVYSFGAAIEKLLPEATDELDLIKAAVKGIETDSSGIENVMTAVATAANNHASLRKLDRQTREPERNVMLIVVSDEAGDDVGGVEEAISICTRLTMPVYVVGVPAPFGRPETYVKWVDPILNMTRHLSGQSFPRGQNRLQPNGCDWISLEPSMILT